MDLSLVISFLFFYYIRPQEWSSLFADIKFIRITMMLGLISLFFRDRSVRIGDLFRTPHDWMIFFFWQWIIWSSQSPWNTFNETLAYYVYYIFIVQTLHNVGRITMFMGWWTFLIVTIAALSLLAEIGFDPLGSSDVTNGPMKGRLILNLSIFQNPNALGHNVVPAIPMLYYYCIWKRPLFLKEVGLFCMSLPVTTIWLTESKGSFLSGVAATVATLTFGRPKSVQALIIIGAMLFGSTVIYALPRMQELNKSKTDAAIQGRVAAFKHGLRRVEESWTGVGYRKWLEDFLKMNNFNKAAHSSYVQIGCELGKPGLFLMLGVLYCNLRTLLTANCRNDEEERIRRVLFVLILCYMVSSWMVDFGYRPTFFMFTAAVAALHRILHGITERDELIEKQEAETAAVAWRRAASLPASATLNTTPTQPTAAAAGPVARQITSVAPIIRLGPQEIQTDVQVLETKPMDEEQKEKLFGIPSAIDRAWNKLSWVDFSLIAIMTYACLEFWAYMITKM